MRVLVISHSYLDPLNAKSLDGLGRLTPVTAVVPSAGRSLLLKFVRFDPDPDSPVTWVSSRALRLWGSQSLYLSIPRSCRDHRPDVIMVEYNPWSVAFITAWIAKTIFVKNAKMVVCVKKNTYRRPARLKGLIKDWLASWTLRRTDFVLANSAAVVSMLEREFHIESERLAIVPHIGVDADLFSPRNGDVPSPGTRVGYCGRFDEDKGVMRLLEAVALVRASTGEDVTLRVAGTGSLLAELEDIARTKPWFQVHPALEHSLVPQFLDSVDVFVLAAQPVADHEEHDAQALIEAMASGIACIGTGCGVIPEFLTGEAGIIVPAGDDERLAEAISYVVQDPEKRERLGAAARERVLELYTIQAVADSKYRILRRVHESVV